MVGSHAAGFATRTEEATMTVLRPSRNVWGPALLLSVLVLSSAVFAPRPAEGQLLNRVRDRVQRDAERRVEERAVAAARATLDLAEDAIVCAVTDEDCIADARAQGQEPVVVDADGKPISGYQPAEAPSDGPGASVWANYDFVPGDNVLFYHDFEGTRTGNFPSRLDYVAGNMEVVELGENKALRMSGGNGCIEIPLGRTFPERFTIEYRARTSDPLARSTWEIFSGAQEPISNCRYVPKPNVLMSGYSGAGLVWDGGTSTLATTRDLVVDNWADVRISVDGQYWKVYVNERRVANVPRFEFPEAASLHLMVGQYGQENDIYVDEIRVAEGGPRSLYEDLEAEGFVSTTGILFESGSATIRPESTPTLDAVLEMLEEHEDVDLVVEGHTDSEGADAANQALSEQRAASVRRYLADHGIEEGRLDVVGHGESQPVADNATPEGMANNRRVVFRRR
jgi:outer membrane protein OmpA-like peptidoglycan-associated protein